jgi:hypothetical protein
MFGLIAKIIDPFIPFREVAISTIDLLKLSPEEVATIAQALRGLEAEQRNTIDRLGIAGRPTIEHERNADRTKRLLARLSGELKEFWGKRIL